MSKDLMDIPDTKLVTPHGCFLAFKDEPDIIYWTSSSTAHELMALMFSEVAEFLDLVRASDCKGE